MASVSASTGSSSRSASTSKRPPPSRAPSEPFRRTSRSPPAPRTTTRATRSSPRRTQPRCTDSPTAGSPLGLGRGIGPMMGALGLPPVTTAQLEDFAGLMRRLWRGETIVGHDGPAGRYPFLRLDPGLRRAHPACDHGIRPEHARTGGPHVRPRGAAHLLHRRDVGAMRPHGEAGSRGGGARPRQREGLVGLRRDR